MYPVRTVTGYILLFLIYLSPMSIPAQENLSVPDPLETVDGNPIKTPAQWRKTRRPEILEQFRTHVYGRAPVKQPEDFGVSDLKKTPGMMDGRAVRKQVDLTFSGPGGSGTINLLLFLPEKRSRPVPTFLLICHRNPKNIDPTRKHKEDFWPAEQIVENGFAAATFHVSDVDPDHHDGFNNGVHGIFTPNPAERSPDAWGTIGAWAWGASRAMDYLQTDEDIDGEHVAVVGHSRGGKASLWAGARDQRFNLVISNDSGCTGAALARRKRGERIKDINSNFPHWFCDNYKKYNGNEEELPVDQHMLIALMAPRPVYVASASKDHWADPKGEFLSCVLASPVYRLFERTGVGTEEMPEPGEDIHEGQIGYHLRPGKHDMTLYDWKRYMTFAKKAWDLPE